MSANTRKHSPRIKVNVTQEVIDTSTVADSSHCIVAEALKAAVPDARRISVDLATIRFTDPRAGVRYIYLTPTKAQHAILDFDQGKKDIEPFTLHLTGAHVLRVGAKTGRGRSRLVQSRDGAEGNPERHGGQAPPLGPLAGTIDGKEVPRGNPNAKRNVDNRAGRRRQFGLRGLAR